MCVRKQSRYGLVIVKESKLRDCKARPGIERTRLWPKNTVMVKEKNLGSSHLRLLSLRDSSRLRPRSPFSFIPTFDGSEKRTSRTVGLEPFPNLKKEKIPPFTVCEGNDWGRCGRCVSTRELRLRSTCPCVGRPPFPRKVVAARGAV